MIKITFFINTRERQTALRKQAIFKYFMLNKTLKHISFIIFPARAAPAANSTSVKHRLHTKTALNESKPQTTGTCVQSVLKQRD